jgi:hypothetical protein
VDDARQILQLAAEHRTPVSLRAGAANAVLGDMVRVEQAGLVIDGGEARFEPGSDWCVWFTFESSSYRFDASVLETGVMLPNRAQGGVLLGFIDGWSSEQAQHQTVTLRLFAPNGASLAVGEEDTHWVEATLDRIAFTLPANSPIAFVEGSVVRLELAALPRPAIGLGARVLRRTVSEGHFLYELAIESVSDPAAWREKLSQLETPA